MSEVKVAGEKFYTAIDFQNTDPEDEYWELVLVSDKHFKTIEEVRRYEWKLEAKLNPKK